MKRFPALRYKDFRLLFTGQFISTIGNQMQLVAINWHIYLLTNSPIALGLVGLMRSLPIIIFSLIGGSVADVVNRKKLIFVTQTILCVLAFILAFSTFKNLVNPIIIFVITVISAITVSFDLPSRQALIPNLVDKKDLANAMSLNVIMFQISTVVGPLIAGLLISKYNLGNIYAINALTYFGVLVSILFIKTSGSVKEQSGVVSLNSIKEGIVFVKSKTIIWSTMILDFFSTFFASATALFPIFAKDILHVGPKGLGMLYAAPSIGAVVAGVAIAHAGTISKQGKILLTAVCLYAIGTIIFGASKFFPLSILALLLVGVGDSISSIIRNTIRQIATPDYIRGRMTSINMIFFLGGPQLGEFEAGFLAAYLGAPMSVVIGGVGTLIVVGIMALAVPILIRYNNHETN